jgi:hypothetical protein
MDLGNGFGIAKRGGTNLDTGHEKTERKQGVKKQKGSALSPQTLFHPAPLVYPWGSTGRVIHQFPHAKPSQAVQCWAP